MVLHYSLGDDLMACGRTGQNLTSTTSVELATCKRCLASKAVKEPEAVQSTPAPVDSQAPTATPSNNRDRSWRTSWMEKVLAQSPKNRLPRKLVNAKERADYERSASA